jgi:hypothetical protein
MNLYEAPLTLKTATLEERREYGRSSSKRQTTSEEAFNRRLS